MVVVLVGRFLISKVPLYSGISKQREDLTAQERVSFHFSRLIQGDSGWLLGNALGRKQGYLAHEKYSPP